MTSTGLKKTGPGLLKRPCWRPLGRFHGSCLMFTEEEGS